MIWSSVKIEKLCSKVVSGGTPSTKKDDYYGGDIPWLRTQEVNFVPIDRTELTISELGLKNSSAKWVPANTVIVAMYGATAGRSAITKIPLTTNQACCNLIVNPDVADYRFLYYSLVFHFKELESLAHGSAQTNLSLGVIKAFEISCPILSTQTQIAQILSAYDDLIENNRRRIALLEEAARKLYKEWFVKRRFPGWESVPVGGDGLLQGWSNIRLDEVADITMGQSPESSSYNPDGDGLPFHQGVTGFGTRFPTNEKWCTAGTRFADEGDILFSVRAPVGRINVSLERIVIGRGLSAMRSKHGMHHWLLYALSNHFSEEDMIGVGCIFAATTKKELFGVKMLYPGDALARTFDETVAPFDAQIKDLSLQNRLLAQSRDKLLPKLMSGELSVENIALPTA